MTYLGPTVNYWFDVEQMIWLYKVALDNQNIIITKKFSHDINKQSIFRALWKVAD